MFRRLFIPLMGFVFTANLLIAGSAAGADKPLQLVVNGKKLAGVHPIVKSGSMYVPFRPFMEATGSKVVYDAKLRAATGRWGDDEIAVSADGYFQISYNDEPFTADDAGFVRNGQTYISIRLLGELAGYSVTFDAANGTVRLVPFGYGEEAAVRELVEKYYQTFSPSLLTSNNLKSGYMEPDDAKDAEAQAASEIPTHSFVLTMDSLAFASPTEATVRVTYVTQSYELDRVDKYHYDIRKERGQWRIANDVKIYGSLALPADIDVKAAAIREERPTEQEAVLSDLSAYYEAFNREDPERTLLYTAPSFVEDWNVGAKYGTWDQLLEASFANSDARWKLSKERVVFLGGKEAVVHGTLSWSDQKQGYAEGALVFDALIYMEYEGGRWTYLDYLDLDRDFDLTEEQSMTGGG